MNRPRALIIDDEPDILELLAITLGRMGIDAHPAEDLAQARALLKQNEFHFCLTDMRLPDGSGLDLVEEINRSFPTLPVAVITAHGNMESAIQALKLGAFDFVSKPVDLDNLRKLIQSALKLGQSDASSPDSPPPASEGELQFHGKSAAIDSVRQWITRLARSQAPVYISGESGVGKELAARLIHQQGPRNGRPFIAINCGAIPRELMESELFGHRKGSFTGAVADKEGLFQAANGGTLFLDEVADLPLEMQVKLLRAIQERAVRPIGAQQEQAVDVRLISATHQDLGRCVVDGTFRQDLYFRINVIELPIPPLRERPEDIPELCTHLMQKLSRQNGANSTPPKISEEALAQLGQQMLPGNVRELENLLERAITLCEGAVIEADHLQLRTPTAHLEGDEPGSRTGIQGTDPTTPALSLDERLEQLERKIILEALEATRWNRTEAAKRLGISFRALRYRLDKLGLNRPTN